MSVEPTNLNRSQLPEPPLTTRKRRDGQGNPLSRFQRLLEGDTTEASTVTLRYVRIVVLNFLLLTTVSVTGERATSVSLTLAMPRGTWFHIGRYRRVSSKSQSPTSVIVDFGSQWDKVDPDFIERLRRPWYSFLTRG